MPLGTDPTTSAGTPVRVMAPGIFGRRAVIGPPAPPPPGQPSCHGRSGDVGAGVSGSGRAADEARSSAGRRSNAPSRAPGATSNTISQFARAPTSLASPERIRIRVERCPGTILDRQGIEMGRPINSGEIRIGIVGAGQITRTRHFPGFRAIPGVRIVGGLQPPSRNGEAGRPRVRHSQGLRQLGRPGRRSRSRRGRDRSVALPALPGHAGGLRRGQARADPGADGHERARSPAHARPGARIAAPDRHDRSQSLRPDRRRVHALADRLGVPRQSP